MIAAAAPETAQAEPEVAFHVEGDAITEPLTDLPGDPARGRAVFLDREAAHCLLCHAVTTLEEPFQGDIAPDLTEVGDRLAPGQLRLRIVDPTLLNADTPMPSYYRIAGFRRVAKAFKGRPVLDAQQVEDLVAYLSSLTSEE